MRSIAPPTADTVHAAAFRNRSHLVAYWAAGVAVSWWVIDLIFARTILVTPIAATIWWAACLAGAIGGTWVGLVVAVHEFHKAGAKARGKRPALIALFCALGLLFGPLIANRAMWRIANTAQFGNSDAPIAATAFPIRRVSSGKGSSFTASIGSRGQYDALPITKQDFELLRAGALQRPWQFCLTLRRQEQGQAVRIWLPSRPRPSFRGLTVVRCPAPVQWID